MKKNKYIFVLLLLISITVVSSLGTFFYIKNNNKQNTEDDDNILIMTSCNPVYIATLNVVGSTEGYTVENLSQPTTGCLHDYTLTTEDMKKLSKADILVVNGGGMEGYLEDVMEAYPNLKIIDTYEYIEHSLGEASDLLIEEEEEDEEAHEEEHHEDESVSEEAHEESHEHHHEHGANSHIWMDDRLFEMQVAAIANELMGENLNREETPISNNYLSYTNNLNAEIDKQGLEKTLSGSNVAVLHEAFSYTAQSLGANVAVSMDLDEERQVSAGEVSEFIQAIQDNDIKIVFAEYDYGNAMGKLIEEQTDAKVVYLETLVHGSYDASSYITIQNQNYKKIKEAL